jgi:hypothetical protein
MALYRIAPIANIGDTFDGLAGSGGKLVKGVDGDEKISLDEDNSRCSYNQEGAGLNITNFDTGGEFSFSHLSPLGFVG